MARVEDNVDLTALEDSLNAIRSRNSDASRISDCDTEYILKIAEDAAKLQQSMRDLMACQTIKEDRSVKGLLDDAHVVLQKEMIKLENYFVDLLKSQSQPMEPNTMSSHFHNSSPDDVSVKSFGEEPVQEKMEREENLDSEEISIDVVSPDALTVIKEVAKVMFMAGYDLECCQCYIAVRKDALDELSFLHMEKLTIEEVSGMKWGILGNNIFLWIKVIKNFVRDILDREKHLCSHIFGDLSQSASRDCFCESAKGSMMQLLSFAEAVALATPAVEGLFRVLDVYDSLIDLRPDIESLNLNDSGSSVMSECREILSRLRDSGREAFLKLKDEIQLESNPPDSRGGRVRVTRYVMNYAQLMADYENTISLIFGPSDMDDMDEERSCSTFSLADHMVHFMSALESNLHRKSSMYSNPSLQHLFMSDNLHYMVQKVKDKPHLRCLLGDDWLRDHLRKCKEHANLYERESIAHVVSNLVDDLKLSVGNKKIKSKLKKFNLAFEDFYKVQTGWLVDDKMLREDLCLSIIKNVVNVYRHFLHLHDSSLDSLWQRKKYVKYTPEVIENHLWDLFEGTPKSVSS